MTFEDRTMPCRDCGGAFVFTAGEQEFYAQKGFGNDPTRCPLRRRQRKGLEGTTSMAGQGMTSSASPSYGTGGSLTGVVG